MTQVQCLSIAAVEQIMNIPFTKVDRGWHETHFLERLFPKSFTTLRSNSEWKKRRDATVKCFGLNYISKNVSIMVDQAFEKLSNLEPNKEVDFIDQSCEVTFNILVSILFGQGVFEKCGECKYVTQDGPTEMMKIGTAINTVAFDHINLVTDVLYRVSPWLADLLQSGPIKRNKQNISEIYRVLQEFLELDKDNKDSAYRRFIDEFGLTEEEALHDTLLALFVGNDTTSRSVVSGLYYLKKHPEIHEKLVNSLNESGLTKDTDFKTKEARDAIQGNEYLTYFFKEILRLDNPAGSSLERIVFEDVDICGVHVPKG